MSIDSIFLIFLLVCAMVSFVWEKIPTDQTAITIFAIILLAGYLPIFHNFPTADKLLSVLANPAPLTIAAMFIISAALEKCGVIESVANRFSVFAQYGYRKFLFVMTLSVAAMSAFINNTPVVVVFLPVILSLSRKMDIPASKLLIPLSYASIFGGCCTLMGTSTNILASGIVQKAGYAPIGMFDLASVGVPLLIVGSLYLVLLGDKLLPKRETLTAILSEEERREYITEAFVPKSSAVTNHSIEESGLLKSKGIRVLEIIRNEVAMKGNRNKIKLLEGDRLVLSCRPSGLAHARQVEGFDLAGEMGLGLETIAAHEGSIVEGVIGPRSTIAGKAIKDLNFRQRYRMILLAIHRRGINLRDKVENVPLEFGDTLLMMGTDNAIENLRRNEDILLLDRPATAAISMRKKRPIVLSVLASIIVFSSLNIIPIVAGAIIGCTILFATGCIKPKEGYDSIEWSILILIYGMLGVGLAMQETGTSDLISNGLVNVVNSTISESMRPYVLLALFYLSTAVLTEILSNVATIVLMAPLGLGLAASLQVNPQPFIIAACIASSASFSSPIGYQTNTYVYGVGGYKFRDFLKIGLPLAFIYFLVSIIVIPAVWAF